MLRNILAQARVYSLFAQIVGASRGRQIFIQRHVRPHAGDRVQDIGCGPADILEYPPAVDYYGFDLSANYIKSARKRFGARGHFYVQALSPELVRKYSGFNLVLANGVLHHLTDAESLDLFRLAKAALIPGGRLVTLDGCFTEKQCLLARYFLKYDRGKHVRRQDAYVKLAREVFDEVRPSLTTELLRIPYTHLVLECQQ